jgi:hypothetical protein
LELASFFWELEYSNGIGSTPHNVFMWSILKGSALDIFIDPDSIETQLSMQIIWNLHGKLSFNK